VYNSIVEIKNLKLQNFRNHTKSKFEFYQTTIIVGENTSGKTSILEALFMLSHGKSFKADSDIDTINEKSEFSRIDGTIFDAEDETKLAIVVSSKNNRLSKKYLVNNVGRIQNRFISYLLTVLFTPEDLEIITDSPSLRRNYINSVLIQADKEYRVSLSLYEKDAKKKE